MCESEIDDGWTELLEVRRARKRVTSAVLVVEWMLGFGLWGCRKEEEQGGVRDFAVLRWCSTTDGKNGFRLDLKRKMEVGCKRRGLAR